MSVLDLMKPPQPMTSLEYAKEVSSRRTRIVTKLFRNIISVTRNNKYSKEH